MSMALEAENPLDLLDRLAKDPNALKDLAAAIKKSEMVKREADISKEESDKRFNEAATAEHILRRHTQETTTADVALKEKITKFEKSKAEQRKEAAQAKKDMKVIEDSLTQRETMLEEGKAALEVNKIQAAKDLEKGKSLRDEFASKLARIKSIATE